MRRVFFPLALIGAPGRARRGLPCAARPVPVPHVGHAPRPQVSTLAYEEHAVRRTVERFLDRDAASECTSAVLTLVRQLKEDHERLLGARKQNHERLQALLTGSVQESERHRKTMVGLLRDLVETSEFNLKLQTKVSYWQLLEALEAKGLSDTKGLFEWLQEELKAKLPDQAQRAARGAALWKWILLSHPDLIGCVAECCGLSPDDTQSLALYCHRIYSTLSDELRNRGWLPRLAVIVPELELYANDDAALYFRRAPMSREQSCVLSCIAKACGYSVKEYPTIL